MLCMRPLRLRLRGDCGHAPNTSGALPLNLAQKNAWSLSRTLMTIVIVFRIDSGNFGVAEAQEYDGDPSSIVREYDPFAR